MDTNDSRVTASSPAGTTQHTAQARDEGASQHAGAPCNDSSDGHGPAMPHVRMHIIGVRLCARMCMCMCAGGPIGPAPPRGSVGSERARGRLHVCLAGCMRSQQPCMHGLFCVAAKHTHEEKTCAHTCMYAHTASCMHAATAAADVFGVSVVLGWVCASFSFRLLFLFHRHACALFKSP